MEYRASLGGQTTPLQVDAFGQTHLFAPTPPQNKDKPCRDSIDYAPQHGHADNR